MTYTSDSPEIQYLCKKDKRLAKLIEMVGPIHYELHDDPYAFLVHEVIEQMLSVKVGNVIFGRLEYLCGGEVTPESVARLTDEEIRSTGMSSRKVQTIRCLSQAEVAWDELVDLPDAEVVKMLTSIHGIGAWTAKMYLMFVLGREDVLPVDDVAFLQVYKWLYKTEDCSPAAVRKKCRKWSRMQPWRADISTGRWTAG